MTVEVLDPPEHEDETALIHIASIAHPLSIDRVTSMVKAGPTIADLIRMAGVPPWAHVRVYLDGDLIYPEFYHVVRPRRGSHVVIRAVPRGGGGGGSSKNVGMLIVGILLIVVGLVLMAFGNVLGSYVLVIGIGLTLSAVINMLIPPPVPPKLRPLSGLGASEAESPTLSIAGQRNSLRPYAPMPRVLGRHKIFPPYAALPFTETVGSDQYLRLLFWIGLGVTEIEDLKIGETAIANFQNVEIEIRTGAAGEPPLTLYTQDVFEDPLSVALTFAGGPQIRTSQSGAVELSIAIAFPQGLVLFSGSGTKNPTTVSITAEYRLVGQTAWVPVPGSPIVTTEARQALVRAGIRWKPQVTPSFFGAAAWSQFGLASFTASRINDGVLNVIAFDADAAAAGSWLMADTTTKLDLGRVVVTSAGTGANCTWDVQWSDDLVAWTTVFSGFSTGAAATQSAEWAAPGAKRYWRLLKTNAAVAGPDYYEVQFWRTAADGGNAQFDVRLTRTTADAVDPNLLDASVWSALRTFGADPPIAMPAGVAYAVVAMRIKATDQLNGIVDNFNCIATAKILDYATYAGSVLADLPLGYWRLGEVMGAPTAFDASGNGRAGTYRGAPVLGISGFLTGDADTAMKTTAVDAWVDTFTGLSAIDMGGMSFSIEAIISFESVAAGVQHLLQKGSGDVFTNGPVGIGIRRNAAALEVVRNAGGGAPTVVAIGGLAAGTRYFVQVTYNKASGLLALYLNYSGGSASASVGTGAYQDSYGLYIGRQASGSVFYGTIDEVSVFPSTLSDPRRQAHHDASNGTREWVVQRTSNPASLYRTILQDVGTARPAADARLDLAQLQAWHQECSSGGRSCNLVVDYKTTQNELLRVIAACGRATPTMNDGKYATVRDLAQTVPVQHFTPRNSRNFKGHRVLPEALHALKVRFMDPLASWQQSERIVYDDGYTAANATRFEVLELHGITDPDQAWRIGRYHIAVARLRPEFYEFETDVEHLVARRGDMVRVAHDVTEWGLAQGRIKGLWPLVAFDSLRGASFWSQSGLASFVAAEVNDGDLTVTTAFTANAALAGSWLQIDLGGSPLEYAGVHVWYATGTVLTWEAQFSDDALAWVTVGTLQTGAGADSFAAWYLRGVAHRYWRIRKTSGAVAGSNAYFEVSWIVSTGTIFALEMDEKFPMLVGQTYAVRVRRSDGSSLVATLQTVAGDNAGVTLATPISGSLPAVGDLAMFGLQNQESVAAIVSRIVPGPEFSAVLTVVDAAPAVLTADQGAIPPWDPQMTRQAPIELLPPTPLVTSVVSDETVLIRDLDGSLISRIVVALEYMATSNLRADYVEARFRRAGSGAPFESVPQLPPDVPTVSVTGVEDGVAYDVRIRTVNRDGPTSPWAEVLNHVVVGKTSAPIAPQNLRLEGGRLAWDYPTPPLDFDGFEVRRSPGATGNWETALEMHVGLVFSPFDLGTIYNQWTFLVAAVDTSGNASSPASLTVNFGNPLLHNTVASKDYDADGYPGTITNGAVAAGDLKADQLTTGFWTQNGNKFWSVSGATLFWQGTYKQMTYDFAYTTGANAGGARIVFSVVTIVAVSWSLYYRVGTSGDYLPWPGVLESILASQEYDFRLITSAGVVQGVVSGLTLVIDAEDLTEPIQNFATAVTTGSRVTLAKTYRAIKKVEVSVLASGAETAITAIAADQQNTAGAGNGPLIKSFDAAGAVVAGHVNGEVTGY